MNRNSHSPSPSESAAYASEPVFYLAVTAIMSSRVLQSSGSVQFSLYSAVLERNEGLWDFLSALNIPAVWR